MPERASTGKVRQAEAYGAGIRLVPGGRPAAQAAAQKASRHDGVLYASHTANPHFHHGVKTWAYEVRGQLGTAPGTVVVPVGSGSLLLGIALGFRELLASGVITTMPRLIAVQSAACAPLTGRPPVAVADAAGHPVAEGIAVPRPARLRQLRQEVTRSSGEVVIVEDWQILQAHQELARNGFYVEPTSAVAWAGWKKLAPAGPPRGHSVITLTGSGLKTGPAQAQALQLSGRGTL